MTDDDKSASPAPALPEAKPVAWMWRHKTQEGYRFVAFEPPDPNDPYLISEPLYASPVQLERAEAKPVASPAEGEAVVSECPTCHGLGGWIEQVPSGPEIEEIAATCPDCNGTGRIVSPDREAATREAVRARLAKALWMESASFRDKEAHWDTPGQMLEIDRQPYFDLADAAIRSLSRTEP